MVVHTHTSLHISIRVFFASIIQAILDERKTLKIKLTRYRSGARQTINREKQP